MTALLRVGFHFYNRRSVRQGQIATKMIAHVRLEKVGKPRFATVGSSVLFRLGMQLRIGIKVVRPLNVYYHFRPVAVLVRKMTGKK